MKARVPGENLDRLRKSASSLGVDLISSARIGPEHRGHLHQTIRDIASSLEYALVFGIRLAEPVLETIIDAPNWTYYHHYRTVNLALDHAALLLAGECQRMGHRAMPIPASQILNWERLQGHLSHRELGALAGLGWWGRNNLLVNKDYGAQVRYATVLTDLPLPERGMTGTPTDCGDCLRCLEVCPVGAIHEDPVDFDLDKCTAQLRRFSRSEKLNSLICGLCVRECPGPVKR